MAWSWGCVALAHAWGRAGRWRRLHGKGHVMDVRTTVTRRALLAATPLAALATAEADADPPKPPAAGKSRLKLVK